MHIISDTFSALTANFFEAHEVLEVLWLANKQSQTRISRGLIQFAGAFVHLQKNRLRPSAALLKSARANLQQYPRSRKVDLKHLLELIAEWLGRLESSEFAVNPLAHASLPSWRCSTALSRD
jgi:predicted metal-dependent hydrolase